MQFWILFVGAAPKFEFGCCVSSPMLQNRYLILVRTQYSNFTNIPQSRTMATCWTRPSSLTRTAVAISLIPHRFRCRWNVSRRSYTMNRLFEKQILMHSMLSIGWDSSALASISHSEPTWLVFTAGEMGAGKSCYTMNRLFEKWRFQCWHSLLSSRWNSSALARISLLRATKSGVDGWVTRKESGFITETWHLRVPNRETAFQLTGCLAMRNGTRTLWLTA